MAALSAKVGNMSNPLQMIDKKGSEAPAEPAEAII
jgi:hypothetical protein